VAARRRTTDASSAADVVPAQPDLRQVDVHVHALAGAKERVVVGHDPEVATRFDQVEPGIIKIA